MCNILVHPQTLDKISGMGPLRKMETWRKRNYEKHGFCSSIFFYVFESGQTECVTTSAAAYAVRTYHAIHYDAHDFTVEACHEYRIQVDTGIELEIFKQLSRFTHFHLFVVRSTQINQFRRIPRTGPHSNDLCNFNDTFGDGH